MVPEVLDGEAVSAGEENVGRGAGLDPPLLQAERLAPDGLGPAVPDGEAGALATVPPCFWGDAPQLTNIKPARMTPTASRRTWSSRPTGAVVIYSPTRTGMWANCYCERGLARRMRGAPPSVNGVNGYFLNAVLPGAACRHRTSICGNVSIAFRPIR